MEPRDCWRNDHTFAHTVHARYIGRLSQHCDMNSQNQALRTALVHQQKRVKDLELQQQQAQDETARLKVCTRPAARVGAL